MLQDERQAPGRLAHPGSEVPLQQSVNFHQGLPRVTEMPSGSQHGSVLVPSSATDNQQVMALQNSLPVAQQAAVAGSHTDAETVPQQAELQ